MKTTKQTLGYQLFLAVLGLLSGMAILFSGASQAAITGSTHDFSTTNGQAFGTDEICVFCHAPHNAPGAADGPLWNRSYIGTGYTMYDGAVTGSDLQGTLDADVSGVPALCLSCHDGVTNVDAFGGGAGTTLIGTLNANADFSSDLSDDHPINIEFTDITAAADNELYPPSSTTVPALSGTIQARMLTNDQVVCASCHDVHNTVSAGNAFLLKVDNTVQSALCLTCHNK